MNVFIFFLSRKTISHFFLNYFIIWHARYKRYSTVFFVFAPHIDETKNSYYWSRVFKFTLSRYSCALCSTDFCFLSKLIRLYWQFFFIMNLIEFRLAYNTNKLSIRKKYIYFLMNGTRLCWQFSFKSGRKRKYYLQNAAMCPKQSLEEEHHTPYRPTWSARVKVKQV